MNSSVLELSNLLAATLDFNTRQQAEQHLASVEQSPQFSVLLLKIVQDNSIDSNIRFSAVVYFKNFIKKLWLQNDDEPDKISSQDRDAIKATVVDLMISVPPSLQLQLSEAVTLIANNDFPSKWPNLVQELLSKLNLQDFSVNIGVLQTAHSIFKRWRHQFKSNELFTEIKMVLELFSAPFLAFIKETDKLIDANSNNSEALKVLFQALFLCTKIFYSLNSQDLPEYFEDHQDEFMILFQKYLEYQNPLLQTDQDDIGPLEKVKASICEIIDLYATKYEEDFKKLPVFVSTIWNLLTTVGLEPKNDYLVSKAIGFLTSVVKPERHRSLFESRETIELICSKIIVPNMTLRESDVELFEDDPIEFIRRDLEGSDTETRRRAASDLVRGLLEHFAAQVTEICLGYVTRDLQEYERDRINNWKSKDTALYLITSLSARALTIQTGATQTNEHIQVLSVFTSHILPDLQSAVDGAIHPIIKVDVIKYLLLFRSQLSKEQLLAIFPPLTSHLTSTNYVVYTYAAVCIEKILSIKTANKFMFQSSDIGTIAQSMVQRLFDLISSGGSPAKIAENDYLMKAIMRIVAVLRDDVSGFVEWILQRLTPILQIISKNPSNPKFNHFAFETLALLVKFSCSKNVSLVTSFETFLFPVFIEIIKHDSGDFSPYVYQVLSQLLNFHGKSGIPAQYSEQFPHFVASTTWENNGNIPALVKLLSSFLVVGSNELVSKGQLNPILGVIQKLISSRMNDQYGFELLISLFQNVSTKDLAPFVKTLFMLLLTRLMQSKTQKFTKEFINFICYLCVLGKEGFGIDDMITVLDSIQERPLFFSLLQGIILPELKEGVSHDHIKLTIVGLTKLLCESRIMLSDNYFTLWPQLMSSLLLLISNPLVSSKVFEEEDEILLLDMQEEAGYQTNYSRLSTMGALKYDLVDSIADPKLFLANSLLNVSRNNPGKLDTLIQQRLTAEASADILGYFSAGFR